MSNAVLEVTIHRSGDSPVKYTTMDYEDINHARREYQKIAAGVQSLVIGDADDAGFLLIPIRNVTGIQVRECYPDEERKKAEERQRAEMHKAGDPTPIRRALPRD